MPRLAKKYYISFFLHIMVQGINKETIFKDEFYKKLYLKLIKDTVNEFDINLLAYVIMDNHVHILLNYNNIDDISKCMHKINQNFAQLYNKNENRVGYVFRNRYRSEQIIDKAHLYTVLAYIHFNPYKAGIINKLSDYKFSAYNQYFNKVLDEEEVCKKVIDDFKKRNGINTTEIIMEGL